MREAARFLEGLSLHYYTVPGTWENKGSATVFTEDEWFITMKKALFIDEIITGHAAIMDKYDPDKRVALIVDEWGTWYDVGARNESLVFISAKYASRCIGGWHYVEYF